MGLLGVAWCVPIVVGHMLVLVFCTGMASHMQSLCMSMYSFHPYFDDELYKAQKLTVRASMACFWAALLVCCFTIDVSHHWRSVSGDLDA